MGGNKLREIVLQCIEDSSEERPSAEEVFEMLRNEWSKIRQKRNIADNKRGPQLKIAVLGHLGVGKTCLISRYVDHNFNCKFVASTINADQFFSAITLHGKEFRLQIIDTAGQERFRSIIPNSIRNSQGVVLVFDLTNRSSLVDGIPEMLEFVKANTPDSTSLILVGNKADMADRDARQRVHKEEADQRAQELGIRRYVETSATTGQNLERVFELIANDIYDTLDLSDIDIYVPGDHIEVANEDAPRNRSFLEKIGDCFQSFRTMFGL